MAGKPWCPPLNEHDRLVIDTDQSPYLYVSEWLSTALRARARAPAMTACLKEHGDPVALAKHVEVAMLAKLVVDEYWPMFPELDVNGDCIVDGKYYDGAINRDPALLCTCGMPRDMHGPLEHEFEALRAP